jgi:hypothetical protein
MCCSHRTVSKISNPVVKYVNQSFVINRYGAATSRATAGQWPDVPHRFGRYLYSTSPDSSGRSLSPELAKIVDLKGLLKLQTFDGSDKGWQDWCFRFTSIAVLLNLEPTMKAVAAQKDAFDDDLATGIEAEVSLLLWGLLVQCVHGRAYSILRSYPRGHGLFVWQALVREYAPSSTAKHMSVLAGLLSPKFSSGLQQFHEQFLRWEQQLHELEVENRNAAGRRYQSVDPAAE